MAYPRRVKKKNRVRRRTKSGRVRKTRMAKKAIRRVKKRGSNLPNCTKLYAKALLNPHDPSVVGVCYPAGLTIPSMKFHQKIKGTITVHNNGIGAILMRDNLNKDQPTVFTTNSAVTGWADPPEDTLFTAFESQTETKLSQIPFEVATFTSKGIEGRMVTMGYRYKYAGRQDALAGICYDLEEPDHKNLQAQSLKNVMDHRMTFVHPMDNDWHYVKWSGPVKQEEVDYSATGYAGNTGDYLLGTVFIGLPAGSSIIWEADVHLEFHGAQAFAATFNQVDEVGSSKVVNAAKKDAQDHTVMNLEQILNTAYNIATDPRVQAGGIAAYRIATAYMHSQYDS